jgi:hypothetical protein
MIDLIEGTKEYTPCVFSGKLLPLSELHPGESMKEKNAHLFMEILVGWNVTARRINITELTDQCPLYKLYCTFHGSSSHTID